MSHSVLSGVPTDASLATSHSMFINSLVVKAVSIYTANFFSNRYYMSGTVVHLLEWPTLALCSSPILGGLTCPINI